MAEKTVTTKGNLSEEGRILATVDGVEIGVFTVNDQTYAYENKCPNQGGPICEGELTGTTSATYNHETHESTTEWIKEGEILVCPWCSWEYDILAGESQSNKGELTSCDVRIEDGAVVVSV